MRAIVVEDSLAARTRLVEVVDADPERHSCRPSVDVLLESVAREIGPDATACVIVPAGRVLPLDQLAPVLLELAARALLERKPS